MLINNKYIVNSSGFIEKPGKLYDDEIVNTFADYTVNLDNSNCESGMIQQKTILLNCDLILLTLVVPVEKVIRLASFRGLH